MLTVSEQKTLHYVEQFIVENQHAPTTAEIAEGIGIASRGVAHRYLKALQKKGHIKLTPNRHRNIVLLDHSGQAIPMLGSIAAGSPIEAVEQNETVDVASFFLGKDRYALRVKGDSMIEDGIHDGDIIICERCSTAADGQIVIALIEGQEATLKRLFHNDNKTITLLPANPEHKPQLYQADQVEVQGIYVGLLRIND